MIRPSLVLAAALTLSACSSPPAGAPEKPVVETPAVTESERSDFYKKTRTVGGVPIIASAAVHDAALDEAARILSTMVAGRPELPRTLADRKIRIALLGVGECTTDLPEKSGLRPRQYFDIFERTSAAGPGSPLITVGEENLLGYRGDPGAGESLLVREVGRALGEARIATDREFAGRLDAAHAASLKARPPGETIAPPTRAAYWAAGVQAWFGGLKDIDRAVLKRSDPALAALVGETFGEGPPVILAAGPDEKAGDPEFVLSPESVSWAARFRRGEETLAPPEATILPMLPPGLHRSLRPGYMKDWRSPSPRRNPTRLYFTNASDAPVRLDRMDSEGRPVRFAKLWPGEHLPVDTTAGEVWQVCDDRTGRLLGYTVAAPKPAKRVIENAEEEDRDFEEEEELDVYDPLPMDLHPASEYRNWSSSEAFRECRVIFANDARRTLIIEYVDRGGETVPLGKLRCGDRLSFATFAGQIWRVREADGTILGYLISSTKPGLARFTDATKAPELRRP